LISKIAIPKKEKEELIGFSNYQRLSSIYVNEQRQRIMQSPHEKVILKKPERLLKETKQA